MSHVFLVVFILLGMYWYLIVILIFSILLKANDSSLLTIKTSSFVNAFSGLLLIVLINNRRVFFFFCLFAFLKNIVDVSLSLYICIVVVQPLGRVSLWPHGLPHTRPPCPWLSPRVCPSSCALIRWCYPTISSSAVLVSFCLQSFPASGAGYSMAHSFIELCKPLLQDKAVIHEGDMFA